MQYSKNHPAISCDGGWGRRHFSGREEKLVDLEWDGKNMNQFGHGSVVFLFFFLLTEMHLSSVGEGAE